MLRKKTGRKLLLLSAVAVATALTIAGCSGGTASGGSSADSKSPIVIGASLPLSGSQAQSGEWLANAYKLVTKQVNDKGGINGRKIKLIILDDKFDPTVASTNVTKLVTQDKAVALLGTYGSDPEAALQVTAEQYGIPNIQATGSAPILTSRGLKYAFITQPSSEQAADAMTAFMGDKVKPKTVAIVYGDNPFSSAWADRAAEKLKSQGSTIVESEQVAVGATSYTSVLQGIAQKNPDALMLILYGNDYITMMKNLRQIDYAPKFLSMNSDFPFEPASVQALGNDNDYVVSAPIWFEGSPFTQANEFAKTYKKTYNTEASGNVIMSAQVAQIMYSAIEKAGSTKGSKIRDVLASSSFNTLLGKIHFLSSGQAQGNPGIYAIVQLQGMKGVTLAPSNLATGKVKPFPAWGDSSTR